MNLALNIAKRYLLSKKSHNAINIISWISVFGIMVVSAALIVVLSVFNGFENLVISLYNSFDPDIKITAYEGKTIPYDSFSKEDILKIEGVAHYVESIEENALLKYKDKQYIATVKGVDNEFLAMTGLDSMVVEGECNLENDGFDQAIIGQGVSYFLSVNLDDFMAPLNIYVPKRGKKIALDPSKAFKQQSIFMSGVFSIQQEFDVKYVLVPKDFAKELLDYNDEISSIEIGVTDDEALQSVKGKLKDLLGDGFVIKDRFEQHELLYKILKSEKWAVYLILTFILIIAIFNVIGSLTMLILDKKDDIAILRSMGAETNLIRRIFMTEGIIITATGALAGMLLGFLVCMAQIQFGLVKLQGGGSFVIENYPVQMQFMDFIYVFLTVFGIGLLAAFIPVRQIVKNTSNIRVHAE